MKDSLVVFLLVARSILCLNLFTISARFFTTICSRLLLLTSKSSVFAELKLPKITRICIE